MFLPAHYIRLTELGHLSLTLPLSCRKLLFKPADFLLERFLLLLRRLSLASSSRILASNSAPALTLVSLRRAAGQRLILTSQG